MFYLRIFFIIYLVTFQVCANSIPQFSFQDQYENKIETKNLIGKPSILLGCEKEDIDLCRKIGRKIFWKLQNLLWKDSSKVKFIAYLNLKESNKLIEKYISESKEKQFESIYFDRKGELSLGLKSERVYLRIFNSKGNEIFNSHIEVITDEQILSIHQILKNEIK
ncbi:MAG: hypothetical protein SH817_03080 [Leptospira sp.]|nr:hypothetical protein [Leptospira sp.]